MRLAAKLISAVLLILIVSLVIEGEFSIHRERELYRQEAGEDGHLVGHALRTLLSATWRLNGKQIALEQLKAANLDTREWALRWVEPGSPAGAPHAPRAQVDSWAGLERGEDIQTVAPGETGTAVLVTYIPIRIDGVLHGALEVSESLSALEARLSADHHRTVYKIGYLVVLGGVLVIGLGFLFVGKPLRKLIAKTKRIGDGDLTGDLDIRGHNELTLLANSLNQMCDHLAEANRRASEEAAGRINAVEQLRHEDRLRTVGLLSSGIAHEMGTPLNVVSGRAGLIASGKLPAEEVVSSAETIRAQADKMTAIIRQLLDFARLPMSKPERMRIDDLVRQTLEMLAPLASKTKVKLVFEDDQPELHMLADKTRVQQVLTNLVLNAIQAMPEGGQIRIGVAAQECELKGVSGQPLVSCVMLSVEDEGLGIAPEAIEQLFDPFFTTKEVGQGTGLGLSIAYGIVKEHKGWIEVSSEPMKGSQFRVFLPREVS